jgi:hypothetical protein
MHFLKAEQMQQELQPDFPLLYSLWGFRYCDLLLAAPERAAWRLILSLNSQPSTINSAISDCGCVFQRAAQTFKWAEDTNLSLLDVALDHLTLGRAALYEAILANAERGMRNADLERARHELDSAVASLRRASQQDELPHGLLSRAWLRFVAGTRTGAGSAQEDLNEAWEIAERGPMKLFLADIHLYRARLFGKRKTDTGNREEEVAYPWESPAADLVAAEKLITECGYHRRDEELADAKRAILGP